MKLIAKKPCSFGGMKFYIGEKIPADIVLDPNAQEKRGVLVQVADGNDPAPNTAPCTGAISIVIHADEGDLPLELTNDELQSVFDVLTGNAEDAKPIIEQMENGDALLLIHATDNRKTVQNAAVDRAKDLSEAQEGEESEGEQ